MTNWLYIFNFLHHDCFNKYTTEPIATIHQHQLLLIDFNNWLGQYIGRIQIPIYRYQQTTHNYKATSTTFYFARHPFTPLDLHLGYDRKGVLRRGTGNRIFPIKIPVLLTGTGIYFWHSGSLFLFWLNWNRKLYFTGLRPKFTGINFPKKLFYSQSVY